MNNIKKPSLIISGLGHRNINPKEFESIKTQITDILTHYLKNYDVIVETNFAPGADLLIAECAYNLGIKVKAVLPFEKSLHLKTIKKDALETGFSYDEKLLEFLLNNAFDCEVAINKKHEYLGASQKLIDDADKAIVIWDLKEYPLIDESGNEINIGGTYHSLSSLRKKGLKESEIHIIKCTRI